jgi:ferritin
MLNQEIQTAINEQITKELYSAYLYLSMAAYFDANNLPGFAHWMRAQYREETEHALKFYHYVNERGGRVTLKAIEEPQADFGSPLKAFEKTLEHEQFVTSLINKLYELALGEKDYATQSLLKWYIDEQVEEEANASYIVETLRFVGEKGNGLILLDRQLAQRE